MVSSFCRFFDTRLSGVRFMENRIALHFPKRFWASNMNWIGFEWDDWSL